MYLIYNLYLLFFYFIFIFVFIPYSKCSFFSISCGYTSLQKKKQNISFFFQHLNYQSLFLRCSKSYSYYHFHLHLNFFPLSTFIKLLPNISTFFFFLKIHPSFFNLKLSHYKLLQFLHQVF